MQKAKLNNWYYDGVSLHGVVFGHPSLNDGDVITTSAVVRLNGSQAVTQNTLYELGEHIKF